MFGGSTYIEDPNMGYYNDYDYRSNLGAMSTTSSPYSQSSMDSPESSNMSMSPALSPDARHNLVIMSPDEQLTANIAALSTSQMGVPYLEIVEQPVEKFRFRYRSEMMGAHGSLLGRSSNKMRRKMYPSVKLCNYSGPAKVRCSLFTAQNDETMRSPHAHRLVVRVGNEDCDDPHCELVDAITGYTATFTGMGIIHTAKKNISDELIRKKRQRMLEDGRMVNINVNKLSTTEEAHIRSEAELESKTMNLNVVTLYFECHVMTSTGIYVQLCQPVFSQPINNMKSALTGELKICRMDRHVSSCLGNDEVYILVEKVGKKNIQVRFFELDADDNEVWVALGKFSELDVHHQFAIVLRTPPYRDVNISEPVDVFVDLYRPSDGDRSDPIKFKYKPSDKTLCMGRKRARRSSTDTDTSYVTSPRPDPMLGDTNTGLDDVEDSFPSVSSLLKGVEQFTSEEFTNFLKQAAYSGVADVLCAEPWSVPVEAVTGFEDLDLAFDGLGARTSAAQRLSKSDQLLVKVSRQLKSLDSGAQSRNLVRDLFNERTEGGDSALHLAVVHPDKSYLRLMLNTLCRGTLQDVLDLTNHKNETALHLAALTDQDSAIKALLNGGAGCDCVNVDGDTALHLAVKHSHQRCLVALDKHERCTNITREARNEQGWSALHLSVLHNNIEALKHLATVTDINGVDKSGRTVLQLAVEEDQLDMVQHLLDHTSVSVDHRDQSGNTALHVGVACGVQEVVQALLRAGADPLMANHSLIDADDVTIEPLTPLDLAASRPEMLKLIMATINEEQVQGIKIKLEAEEEKESVAPEGASFDQATLTKLCQILDANEGWHDLATLMDLDYLMDNVAKSSSPTKSLLNFADVFGPLTVDGFRGMLNTLNQSEAVEAIDLMLAKLLVEES